jgi:hypothetical protein
VDLELPPGVENLILAGISLVPDLANQIGNGLQSEWRSQQN